MFKRTIFLERRHLRKQNSKKKEIRKQLSEKLEKDIFQNRKRLPQKEFCTKLDFFFWTKICGKGCFSKLKKGKEDFSKKFNKFRFFTWGLKRVFWRIATSVSPCISMHALLVCGLIVHAALFGSRMKALAKSATHFCIHSWNVPQPFSDVSVPLADGGAISHTLVPGELWRHLQ